VQTKALFEGQKIDIYEDDFTKKSDEKLNDNKSDTQSIKSAMSESFGIQRLKDTNSASTSVHTNEEVEVEVEENKTVTPDRSSKDDEVSVLDESEVVSDAASDSGESLEVLSSASDMSNSQGNIGD